MITVRSFRSKILLALVVVALVPAGLTIAAGTVALREIVTTSGTAGPWQSVAESGRVLLDAVREDATRDTALARAARNHREALSESVRLSRLYAFVSSRFLRLLPWFALGTVLLIGALSLLTARFLSRVFSRPIQELVGWTGRIARDEPLPAPSETPPAGVREFEQLRSALRAMETELQAGRKRAVESARLRSWTEMARGVAHELKNPLMPMRMAARSVEALDDPRAREAGSVLMEEIDRLEEMARSFSRLGRMPEGPTAPVDVEELLTEVAAPYREGPARVEIVAEPGLPVVLGWYEPLLAVFRNLLGNAWEAVSEASQTLDDNGDGPVSRTHDSGSAGAHWIRIDARAVDGMVEVTVRDSGPGIPESALHTIWDPDFTTRRNGTGLGLTLVRQAVEAHGGTVQARNAAGGGAEFRVVLPVSGPPEKVPDPRSASTRPSSHMDGGGPWTS